MFGMTRFRRYRRTDWLRFVALHALAFGLLGIAWIPDTEWERALIVGCIAVFYVVVARMIAPR